MIGRGVGAALAAAAALGGLGVQMADARNQTERLGQSMEATRAAQAPTGRTALPGSFHDFMLRAMQRRAAGGGSGRSGPRRYPGLGWSVAQDRRNARKRRNRRRK